MHKRMSAEAVVAAFLAQQRVDGGPITLRDAAAFSQQIGHPYTHETLRNTVIWQTEFPSKPRKKPFPPSSE